MNETLFTYTNPTQATDALCSANKTIEYVRQYCSAIDSRILWLLGVVFLMWLIEPMFKEYIIKKTKIKEDYAYMIISGYKYIGLGLLFMAGYLLWVVAHV